MGNGVAGVGDEPRAAARRHDRSTGSGCGRRRPVPLAQHLAADRSRDRLLVERPDVGEDRMPVLGGRPDVADLANPGERHLQRPRDRSCRQREHVDRRPQPFQLVLGSDAKPLLLVDDQQTRDPRNSMSSDSRRWVPMTRSTLSQLRDRDHLPLLRRGEEAAQHLDPHRVRAEPLLERREDAAGRAASSAPARPPACRPALP